MEFTSKEKSTYNQEHLLIDHNIIDYKFYSDNHIRNKYNIDENGKKISNKEKFEIQSYDEHKQICDFLSLKLEAMEKMNLDDECLIEDETEAKKINVDKNIFPKSEQPKSKNDFNSQKKIIDNKGCSRKNPEHKNNNKNIIINRKGKVEKSKMENIDLVDDINLEVYKESKEKELYKFFSSKSSLISIINEMGDK